MTYRDFFSKANPGQEPFPYQERLAEQPDWPELLDIPTGLGKTAAVSLAWLWKRRVIQDPNTPRRLVWCLPMRVLVEQTTHSLATWLERSGLAGQPGEGRVSLHVLMGGEPDLRSWAELPEEDMILVGTQDMLLSRALMRGYGISRYQWPVQFALLHRDCLWVYDEVQLMGPALATSAQLEGLRRRRADTERSRSLWTSATLDPAHLDTVDLRPWLDSLGKLELSTQDRSHPDLSRRLDSVKALSRAGTVLEAGNAKAYPAALAAEIRAEHRPGTTTLVVLNTVERAREVYKALNTRSKEDQPERLLVHARFRPSERRELESRLRAEATGAGRIVVATQAIEAGVDISSATLFSELAPWSSMVQRFGRCNRYGEAGPAGARIRWINLLDPRSHAPYDTDSLVRARALLEHRDSAAPGSLPPSTDPVPVRSVLRQRDLLDLFNTDPDLSGFDLDVAEYIRDQEVPPLQVFWREFTGEPDEQAPPDREELCPVTIGEAKVLKGREAWRWDSLDQRWVKVSYNLRPGMVLLLRASEGGYDPELGFRADSRSPVPVLPAPVVTQPEAYGAEARSMASRPVLLEEHLQNVHTSALALCEAVGETEPAVIRAALWHDTGKAHPAFQNMLREHLPGLGPEDRRLWAKSSGQGRARYHTLEGDPPRRIERPCFRHELASALLWLAQEQTGEVDPDLVAYLIAAHHGKVRLGLRALPIEPEPGDGRPFARGIHEGDRLPAQRVGGQAVGETVLGLGLMELGAGSQGPSWSARTQRLLAALGPFRLAWLESLVRLADWRATRAEQVQPGKESVDA